MTMGQALQKVDRFFAAFNAQDDAGCREIIDEAERAGLDYRSPMGAMSTADEIMTNAIGPFWRAFPDGAVQTLATAETDDGLTIEHHYTGTHTGPLSMPDGTTVPPTGRAIAFDACTVVRSENGTIRSWHAYFDQMAMAVQLGLIPAPATT
jgi:predicted ester cyclase